MCAGAWSAGGWSAAACSAWPAFDFVSNAPVMFTQYKKMHFKKLAFGAFWCVHEPLWRSDDVSVVRCKLKVLGGLDTAA